MPEQVTLHCTEFTSLCPVTKMPDYAEITIKYSPKHKLIETKSLKLYLLKFRTVAMFNELIVSLIAREINCVVDPISMTVIGEFAVRGGIKVTATEHIGND